MRGLDDWIDRCSYCGSTACYGACQAPRECYGCGAPEDTLSIYCADGTAYCCPACRDGRKCQCEVQSRKER